MADDNTVAFAPLTNLSAQLVSAPRIATSVKLAILQRAILVVSGGGPAFPSAQEPLQDGPAYQSSDGSSYYRPQLAVAARPSGLRPGPDVWFFVDDAGDISLQWTLEVVPFGGDTPGAIPIPFTISSVKMEWAGGSFDFDPPGLQPMDGHAADQPAYVIHGGATLTHEKANELEAAMNHSESACRLTVTFSYDYTVDVPTGDPPAGGGVVFQPGGGGIFTGGLLSRMSVMRSDVAAPADAADDGVAATPVSSFHPVMMSRLASAQLSDALLTQPIMAILAQPTRPEQRQQVVVRSVPFVFEPSDEQNQPIYRSLHGKVDLDETWRHGEAGWVRVSEFPNTVNRLPDDMRLAWNVELGSPYFVPTLHRTSTGEMRVRVLLRLAPWQDPRQLVMVRRIVDMPAAHIIIGEVESSTLRLGGSFPEELAVIGDPSAPAPLTGLDLTLDLSLAYYQLFCKQIAGLVGVPGTVDVVLSTPPADEGATPVPETTHVDVALRLDRVTDLPCTVSLPDELSPATLTVTNASGVDMTIGGASVTLLQVDEHSVVPVDSYPGTCTSAFPVTLAAGASVDVSIGPVAAPEGDPEPAADPPGEGSAPPAHPALIWNGVLVELLDKRLVVTPDALLQHVHELAGASDMQRDITVSSPVFSTGTLPTGWANLASLEVEVTPPGVPATSVVLSLTAPTKMVPAPVTLQDIVTGAPGGISSVSYRVRNNYLDHQGKWSKPQEQSGTDLVVYPHPVEGD